MVVDDHAMVRIGLCEAVASAPNMLVVVEAANGLEAIGAYRKHKPDVVLMDLQMPEMDGVESTVQLRKEFPEAKIILLSIREGEEDVWRANQAGIKGYLPKSSPMEAVMSAIRQVFAGETSFSKEFITKIKIRAAKSDFTPREVDVLRLIVKGRCNKEIATDLAVSEGSVRLYVSRVLEKLGVVDRTQAAVKAIQSGLVHLD